jgi:endonuclease-3
VNQVTPALFARYPEVTALAEADREELQEMIHSTGFYRQKARFLQDSARVIVTEFDGEVPADMEGLVSLPGVARKTANVVLGVAFDIAEGIVVDTHVKRLSQRLGLTRQDNRDKIDQAGQSGQDRARFDGIGAPRRMDRPCPSVDFSRSARLQGAQAGLPQLRTQ